MEIHALAQEGRSERPFRQKIIPLHHQLLAEKQSIGWQQLLFQFVHTLTLPLKLPALLQLLSEQVAQAFELERCVVLLRGQADVIDTVLYVYADYPAASGVTNQVQCVCIDAAIWEYTHTFALQDELSYQIQGEARELNPLQYDAEQIYWSLPLWVENECLGILQCYTHSGCVHSQNEQFLLHTIASQMALALKHRLILEADALTPNDLVASFVDGLLAGKPETEAYIQRQAYSLGFDLLAPHLVALVELSEGNNDVSERIHLPQAENRELLIQRALPWIKQSMLIMYPTMLLVERDNGLICLLPCDIAALPQDIHSRLEPLIQTIQQECHVTMLVGMGNSCQKFSDYAQSYQEAYEAAQIGSCLRTELHCTHFGELGAYRYLYPFAQQQSLMDQYQECIMTILKYDLRKKTNLLDTLEVYLECGGNIARTATLLHLHRNTLLQRISRIQKLCPFDIDHDHASLRLPLLLALKVQRLRAHQLHHSASVHA
ncbi:PucR family transcriptional regulator [Dictyobacter arantiisoli]|uniref:GAF domain-containing protein n=1 Tax=Dictyobacter arantiisoli TaxID=2014874 RepID=A0A5A5T6J6_9CHLR|nr:helix-turn-helix domain-containing protein [Dictyobacter arantiisoli]GCF06987.1 hypothetical protein KDI_05510 [Dictyobacter arantiisoli]